MIHKYIRKEDIPEKTLFVIMTDGYENASVQYSVRKIKEMITKQKEKYKCEFMFIGAKIDAEETAISLALALELNLIETNELLSKAGYILTNSFMFDVIIQYFIKNKIYDIMLINETLYSFAQKLLSN